MLITLHENITTLGKMNILVVLSRCDYNILNKLIKNMLANYIK